MLKESGLNEVIPVHLKAHSQDMGHSLVVVLYAPALVTVLLGQLDTSGPAWPVAQHNKGFVMFSHWLPFLIATTRGGSC